MATVHPIHFQAQWDTTNTHLKEPIPTVCRRVTAVAWNVLSVLIPPIGLARLVGYGVNHFAKRIILPAAHYMPPRRVALAKREFNDFWNGSITDENRSIRQHFTAQEQTVLTPDGAALSATLIRHRHAHASTPTVIYFNGNFQLKEEVGLWLLEKSIETGVPCNFVLFNYREVGGSTGTFQAAKDLIVDGSSIVQWVRQRVGTPAHQIHFYGTSLGGAVAVQTHALDPQNLTGRHLNERSFASFDSMVEVIVGRGCLGHILKWILKKQGCEVDAAAAFRRLQGQKMVVYHPHDEVIPYGASLYNAVQHSEFLRLDSNPWDRDGHCSPLECHDGATDRMSRFLFNLPLNGRVSHVG